MATNNATVSPAVKKKAERRSAAAKRAKDNKKRKADAEKKKQEQKKRAGKKKFDEKKIANNILKNLQNKKATKAKSSKLKEKPVRYYAKYKTKKGKTKKFYLSPEGTKLVRKYLKATNPALLEKVKKHKVSKKELKKLANKADKWYSKKLKAAKKKKADAAKKKALEKKRKAAARKKAAARRKALKKIKSKIAAAEKAGRMEIHLINITKAIDLQIPVLPETFQVSDKQNNETAVVHTTGEVTLLGKTGLREISLESYFPAKKPRYISGAFHSKPYPYYVTKLKKWKDAGNICEVHITLTNIAWQCTIEEFTFSEEGSTGDINYTISLKEYKSPVGRVTKKTKTTKHTVKKKETLKKIAKKYLGKTSFSKSIYKQNKKVIEAAWKKHAKKENKKIKAYNRKHPKKKKKLLKLSSGKGKRLAVGTKLIIKQVVVK